MSDLLDRIQNGFQNFMLGRYGVDRLSVTLIVAALVVSLIGSFSGLGFLSAISFVALVYALFRCYSRNSVARERELTAFEHVVKKPSSWVSLQVKRWKNRSTTCYFTCKNCGAVYSVPKGKGTLRVTCPSCHEKTIHTT